MNALSAPIRGVLFDLDGTLLHTVPDLAAAVNAALSECGWPAIPVAAVERYVGKGIDVLVERCLAHVGQEPAGAPFARLHESFMHRYAIENGRHASVYPGVVEGLAALRSAGLRLGVCTNKAGAFTRPLLERSSLAPYFDLVVAGDTTARKKPAPDMILHAARSWRLQSAQVLMVGDSGNDARAARAAGVPVWLVPYGYNEGAPVQAEDCDGIVAGLSEVAMRLLEP